jgi:hypothetical protein
MSRPPHVRRVYWNEPTMGWWERAYLFEIVRGLSITGRVFVKNMWRWMTGRKGALTTYYPEETRFDYAAAVTVFFFLLLVSVTWLANRISGRDAGAMRMD